MDSSARSIEPNDSVIELSDRLMGCCGAAARAMGIDVSATKRTVRFGFIE
jgi:hypothetical protein